jgi:hypothetical protein
VKLLLDENLPHQIRLELPGLKYHMSASIAPALFKPVFKASICQNRQAIQCDRRSADINGITAPSEIDHVVVVSLKMFQD